MFVLMQVEAFERTMENIPLSQGLLGSLFFVLGTWSAKILMVCDCVAVALLYYPIRWRKLTSIFFITSFLVMHILKNWYRQHALCVVVSLLLCVYVDIVPKFRLFRSWCLMCTCACWTTSMGINQCVSHWKESKLYGIYKWQHHHTDVASPITNLISTVINFTDVTISFIPAESKN